MLRIAAVGRCQRSLLSSSAGVVAEGRRRSSATSTNSSSSTSNDEVTTPQTYVTPPLLPFRRRPAPLSACAVSTKDDVKAQDRPASTTTSTSPTVSGGAVGWVNVAFVVGVVKEIKVGMHVGVPAAELKLSVTQFCGSADRPVVEGDEEGEGDGTPGYRQPIPMCEKMPFTALLVGPLWREYAQTFLAENQIVHIAGRLSLRPMWNQVDGYNYKHEILVGDQCGNVTVVRSDKVEMRTTP